MPEITIFDIIALYHALYPVIGSVFVSSWGLSIVKRILSGV